MQYITNSIPTVTDCDTILAEAGKIKTNLLYKKRSLERQINSYAGDALKLPDDLAKNAEKLERLNNTLTTTMSVKKREDTILELNNTENHQRFLEKEISKHGPVTLLQKQNSLDLILEELIEIDLFTAAITQRKTDITTNAAA